MAAIDEVYGTQVPAEQETQFHDNFADAEARAKAHAAEAEEIRMPLLAKQDTEATKIQKAIAWCEQRELTPLTDADRVVWEKWLPTGYVTPKFGSEPAWADQLEVVGGLTWQSYQYYEGVPSHIRRLIKSALPIFTRLEIRTPERQPIEVMDPALFGHIEHPNGDRDIVLLARWGESDVNWVTFEDIKGIVKTRLSGVRKYIEHRGDRLSLTGCATLASLFFAVFVLKILREMGFSESVMLLGAVATIAIPFMLYWLEKGLFALKRTRFEKEHPHLKGMV